MLKENPFNTQIGGKHYTNFRIQPVDYIYLNNIPYMEGNVIKYISRWKYKNGIEDLFKARHYIDMLIKYAEHEAQTSQSKNETEPKEGK